MHCISVLFVMHLKVMFPNKESSQNSPLQNDSDQTSNAPVVRCMHNISAHIISVCNRGGRQFSNEKKREPRQPELVYCCVFIDQLGGYTACYTTTRSLIKVLRDLFRGEHWSEAQLQMRVTMGIMRAPRPSATAIAAPNRRIAAIIHALQTHPRSRQRGSISSTAAET